MTKQIRLLLTFVVIVGFLATAVSLTLAKQLSFEYRGQPMSEVANEISRQLNYTVLLDEELASLEITGSYINVTLDDFFSRALRGANVIVMYDDSRQQVTVRSFGKKNRLIEFNKTSSTFTTASLGSDQGEIEIQPGVKLGDVVVSRSTEDPLDAEIQPGVKLRDAVMATNDTDPLDREIQPGVRHRDVVESKKTPLEEIEIQPGVKLVSAVVAGKKKDPLDVEIQPGIKLRDVKGIVF